MSHDDWLEMADFYAIGSLDHDDVARFESHLATGCPLCADRVRESSEALVLLARSLPAQTPSPISRARVLHRIDQERTGREDLSDDRVLDAPPRARRRFSITRAAGLAVAAACVVGLMILGPICWTLRQQVVRLEAEVMAKQQEIATRKEVYRYLEDPGTVAVKMVGQAASPEATGHLLWSPAEQHGVLLTKELPRVSDRELYVLWALDALGQAVSAGTFRVDDRGRVQLAASPPGAPPSHPYQEFQVTRETSPPGPRPTGPLYLSGRLETKPTAKTAAWRARAEMLSENFHKCDVVIVGM